MQKYIIDKNIICNNLIQYFKTFKVNINDETITQSALKCLINDLIRNKSKITQFLQNINIPIKTLKDIPTCIITSLVYSYKNIYIIVKNFYRYYKIL